MDGTVIATAMLISGLVGIAIGQKKGRPIEGFFLSFFLGVIGWILLLVGPDYSEKEGNNNDNTQGTITQELKDLAEMRKNGDITQREYQSLKKELINKK